MNDRSSVEVVFFAALECASDAERTAYLEEACRGDDTLRQQVETLLTAHSQVGQFLERPIMEAEGLAVSDELEKAAADLSFLAPSTEPGSIGRLDHYEVLEVVGRGGMGVVLRARDTKLLRVVALKVLAPRWLPLVQPVNALSARLAPPPRSATTTSSPFTRSARTVPSRTW